MMVQEDIKRLQNSIDGINKILDKMSQCTNMGDRISLCNNADRLIVKSQRFAISTRNILLHIGVKDDIRKLNEDLDQAFKIRINVDKNGWVKVILPPLLSRKNDASEFIRIPLQQALGDYFGEYSARTGNLFRINNAIVIFIFYYSREIPPDRCRDIDNIGNFEIKGIIDDIATAILQNDGPFQLFHFYMGARAQDSFTEVYVIPQEDFPKWIDTRPELK